MCLKGLVWNYNGTGQKTKNMMDTNGRNKKDQGSNGQAPKWEMDIKAGLFYELGSGDAVDIKLCPDILMVPRGGALLAFWGSLDFSRWNISACHGIQGSDMSHVHVPLRTNSKSLTFHLRPSCGQHLNQPNTVVDCQTPADLMMFPSVSSIFSTNIYQPANTLSSGVVIRLPPVVFSAPHLQTTSVLLCPTARRVCALRDKDENTCAVTLWEHCGHLPPVPD